MPLSQICTDAATTGGDHFAPILNDLGAKLRRLAQSPETHDFGRRERAVHELLPPLSGRWWHKNCSASTWTARS